MTRLLLSFLLLIGVRLTHSMEIKPFEVVVRQGETLRLMCKSNKPMIERCNWDFVGKKAYSFTQGEKFKPIGDLKKGECGIEVNVTEALSGEFTCRALKNIGVWMLDDNEMATSKVTVLALPQVELNLGRDPIIVTAGESVKIRCDVMNARPTPKVNWEFKDRFVDTNNHREYEYRDRSFMANVTSILTHVFSPEDNGQELSCWSVGDWLKSGEQRKSSARVDVKFPPQPKEPTVLYGLVPRWPYNVTLSFTANPRPSRAVWKITENRELRIQEGGLVTDDYKVPDLKVLNSTAFEAVLTIKWVTKADDCRSFKLVLDSDVNGIDVQTEYTVRVLMKPNPHEFHPTVEEYCASVFASRASGMDSLFWGLVGGGIVLLIVVVVLIVVVLYARKTGRWCFAPKSAPNPSAPPGGEVPLLSASGAAGQRQASSPA